MRVEICSLIILLVIASLLQNPIQFIIGWIILNSLPTWITFYMYSHVKPDMERDKEYMPFVRTDFDQWSYVRAIPNCLMYWPRTFVCWSAIISGCFINGLLLAHKSENEKLTQAEIDRFTFVTKIVATAVINVCLLGTSEIVDDETSDYREFLGPDW